MNSATVTRRIVLVAIFVIATGCGANPTGIWAAVRPLEIRWERASPDDPVLTRRLVVVGAAAVEWSWVDGSSGTGTVVDFSSTTPATTTTLKVRAQGRRWADVSVTTPPVPVLVVMGDSIASGHHRDGPTSATECDDASFGFGAELHRRWVADLPAPWQPIYVNVAHSGYSTAAMLAPSAHNSCEQVVKGSPVADAEAALSLHAGSWNRNTSLSRLLKPNCCWRNRTCRG